MLTAGKKIIDISQPVSSSSACFPGDTPFQKAITLTYKDSGVVNLTSLTMSPHVGTHVDAPVHVCGDMSDTDGKVGDMPLEPFIGPVRVIDLAPFTSGISAQQFKDKVAGKSPPARVIFKTCHQIRYDVFEDDYAYLSVELIDALAAAGVVLTGIDTPSVDHINSKDLLTHHKLLEHKLVWLENLNLVDVKEGDYTLVALPLRFMELEASPVRAVLLEN